MVGGGLGIRRCTCGQVSVCETNPELRAPIHDDMKNILIVVNGPWQAAVCIAALKSRHIHAETANIFCLIVDVQNDSHMYRVTEKLLLASGISNIFFVPKETSLKGVAQKVSVIEKQFQVGFPQMDDILVYGYHRAIARFFCTQCTQARVTVYEEGIRTYTAPCFPAKKGLSYLLRKLRAALDTPYRQALMHPLLYPRVHHVCLLISDLLPLPDIYPNARVTPIAPATMVEVLASVRAPGIKWPHSQKMVLIAGQYYSLLKQMSKETEQRLYRDAAEKILDAGYLPVWRGHIRETDVLFDKLKARCPRLINFSDAVSDPHYPLEFYAAQLQDTCSAMVSISSSSLYYFKKITRIPSYSLIDDAIVRGMTRFHRETCSLAQQAIDSFESFQSADGTPIRSEPL